MANFTEQAQLLLKDGSSGPINKINAALKDLFKTARSLKSTKIDFNVAGKGLSKAQGEIRKLTADLGKLKSAGAVSIKVNARGVTQAQQQLAQLRAQAKRPIAANVTASRTRGGFPSDARAPADRGAAHLARNAARDAASYALQAVGRSIKAGNRDIDVGETSLNLKELTKPHRAFVDKQIDDIGRQQAARPGGAMWNRGQIAQEQSEMLGVVKIGAATDEADFQTRAGAAKFLADQNLELASTFVKSGMSMEAARESSTKFGKALEMQGNIFDSQGKLNVEAAAKQYDDIRRLIPAIGKEATGDNYLSLMKFLRASKFSLEPEAQASAMFKFEEMGTGAAVGINQFVKNLSGSAKPAQLSEMARLGLVPTKEVTSGKVGKEKTKTVTADMSEEDSKLLRTSPQRYTNERIVPALLKDLIKKGLTPEQAEAKLNDPAYVATQMGKMFSDRTAQEMGTSMVLLRAENAQALADWRSRSGTMDSQREATKNSVLGATGAINNQIQGVMGEAVKAAAPILVPLLGTMSQGLQQVGATIDKAMSGDKAAQAQLATGAAIGIPAMAVAAPIMGALKQTLGTMAGPLGMVSGMTAMTSTDPAIRSLGAAGLALSGAASELSGAAGLLGGMGKGLPVPGGTPGGVPGDAASGPKVEKPSMKPDRMGRMGMTPRGVGTAAGVAAAGYVLYEAFKNATPESKKAGEGEANRIRKELMDLSDEMTGRERAPPVDAVVAKAMAKAQEDITMTGQALANAKMDMTAAKRTAATAVSPEEKAGAYAQMASLGARIESLTAVLTQQEFKQQPEMAPSWITDALKAAKPTAGFGDPSKPSSASDIQAAAGTMKTSADMIQASVRTQQEYKPSPEAAFKPTTPSWATDALKAVKPATAGFGDPTQTSSAADVQTAASTLQTASSGFASVFMTGAQQIGAGGQTAASIISSGASSAGAAYGQAAAAAIQGAVSNLTVNVNANVTGASAGADKGAAKAAN